jgi:hypothetical protein
VLLKEGEKVLFEYLWPILIILIAFIFLRFVNDILLIILKVKICSENKAVLVRSYFLKNANRDIIFFESPLLENGFGVHYLSKNKIAFVTSRRLLSYLAIEDLTEIVLNLIEINEARPMWTNLLNRFWTLLFIVPFSFISLPNLFVSKRLFIIEKFFALPIYFFSQVLNLKFTQVLLLDRSNKLTFKKNSMISKIDEYYLGPHLLFYLNSSYYKLLRGKSLAS